jgi:hypothetical protein
VGGAQRGGGVSRVSALLLQNPFSDYSEAPVSRHPEEKKTPICARPGATRLATYTTGNGNGGRGNNSSGSESCLRRCSGADGCPVCGRQRAGWRRRFCGDRHAVKIGSTIKLKPKTLVFRRLRGYYSSVWAIAQWPNICRMTCGG